MRGVGFRIALGLFRFPAPLVSLRCGHAAVLLPRPRAYLSIRVPGPERRVFHQPVLYHRPSAAEDTARLGHSRAHVAHTVRFRERAPPRFAPRPSLGLHSGKRNRRAVPARGRVSPMALLHAAPGVSPVVLGFRGLSATARPATKWRRPACAVRSRCSSSL